MIENLAAALSSLQSALSIGQALVGMTDKVKSQEKLIEFNNAIISAQQIIIDAQAEQQALSRELEELKKFDLDSSSYSRLEIAKGIFAYIQPNASGSPASLHKYCCNCFEQRIKSTLQQFSAAGRKTGLRCSNGCPDLEFYDYIYIE